MRDVLSYPDPAKAVLAAHACGDHILIRTSGSSGAPRSVVRTTDSWVSSFAHVEELTGLDKGSRVWVPGPLTSTMNLFAATHAAYVGAAVVAGPDHATHAQLTPSALSRLLDRHPDLSGLQVVVAGDRLGENLSARASDAGARVAHYYGAAELSFVTWGSHDADLRPFPEVEVAVRDGELWVRSPYVCSGYGEPGGPLRRAADGFVTVGDHGEVVDGLLRVTGRGDAITTGGATVSVDEVERVLRRVVPGDVVVVGVPHRDLGAVVVAVLTDAGPLERARLSVRAALPPSHQPRRWFHLPDLPLTEAGKVDRAEVARMLTDRDRAARRIT